MDGADCAVSLNCYVEARELVGRQCQQRDDGDRHAPTTIAVIARPKLLPPPVPSTTINLPPDRGSKAIRVIASSFRGRRDGIPKTRRAPLVKWSAMGADELTVPSLESSSSSSSTTTASNQRSLRCSSSRKTAATPAEAAAKASVWWRMKAVSHMASTAEE